MSQQRAIQPLELRFTIKKGENEDEGLAILRDGQCLLAAFDGCGGMGGRQYKLLDNLTGAFIAARLYADTLEMSFASMPEGPMPSDWGRQLEALFRESAVSFKSAYLDREPSAVVGSMVRVLPSTAAIALVEEEAGRCRFFWAGDSRGYLLTGEGLRQMTLDDLSAARDPFENLYNDGSMSNFLCADRPFLLHEASYPLPQRGAVLVATDGAFGYLPTPMHFEGLLLQTLLGSSSSLQWKRSLMNRLLPIAGDDVTLMLYVVGYQSFAALKADMRPRYQALRKRYLDPCKPHVGKDLDALRTLWKQYEAEMGQ